MQYCTCGSHNNWRKEAVSGTIIHEKALMLPEKLGDSGSGFSAKAAWLEK